MRIYVGNLQCGSTVDEVQDLFSAHGQVESVVIIRDRDRCRSTEWGTLQELAAHMVAGLLRNSRTPTPGRATSRTGFSRSAPSSDRCKGFAFVEMPCGAEAQAAINALNGKDFHRRVLTVNMADLRQGRRFGSGVCQPGTQGKRAMLPKRRRKPRW